MEYKILTRKNYILDAGLLQKGTTDVVIPFSNMEVDVISNFVLGDKVTLATEEKMEALVNASVVSSHKVIAGEFEVADEAAAAQALADYAAGKDLTFTNGRVFNNGNATPGEVFFMVPTVGSTVKAEELIVGSTKELIALSNENTIDTQFKAIEDKATALETRVTDNEAALTNVDTSTEVDGKIAIEKTERVNDIQTVNQSITSANVRIQTNELDIASIKEKDLDQDGRLEVLEQAESLDDKVWSGNITGAATIDMSTLQDQNGLVFAFTDSKKIEIVMEHTSNLVEQGQDIVIGSANATPYTIGTIGFTAKVDNTGKLHLVKPAGAGSISDFALVRIVEALGATASTTSYSKNESDAKYATISALNLVDSKVNAIDLTSKQGTVDQSLLTATKSVVGAINENNGLVKQVQTLGGQLGSIKTSDGNDLSTTTGILVTEDKIREFYTKAEVDAAIAAALSTIMDVTFDDDSTGQFKLGK